jgi:putative transposase
MAYLSVKDDNDLIELLTGYARDHSDQGFWKYQIKIRNKGLKINHKRTHRVYKALGLSIRRKVKKRLPARVQVPLEQPIHFIHTWSIDFMSDALVNGRKFRCFNVIDDFNREVLFIEHDYSIKSSRVIWVLRHLVCRFGKPEKIRMDNGPEFIAKLAKDWSASHGIEFKHIEPGKPTQNAYIERFNRSYREGVLDAYLFETLEQVREQSAIWVRDYNHERPHDSLGGLPPVVYRERFSNNSLPVLRSASAPPPLHYAQASY